MNESKRKLLLAFANGESLREFERVCLYKHPYMASKDITDEYCEWLWCEHQEMNRDPDGWWPKKGGRP